MVALLFGDLTSLDVVMAVLTGIIGAIVLAIAYRMSNVGIPRWKPRKLVHTVMGTVIAFTVVTYSNLSGPVLAIGIFLTVLLYAWAHKSSLLIELLVAGSRENETGLSTFLAGFMGVIGFAISFFVFYARSEIFVAAILAVAWADAAGEIIGRTFGGRLAKRRFHYKSVEGSIGVFVFSFVAIFLALAVFSDLDPFSFVPQISMVAAATTFVELVSKRWLDNFLLPLVTAVGMWMLLFPTMPLLLPPV